jgi:hypothetical protein
VQRAHQLHGEVGDAPVGRVARDPHRRCLGLLHLRGQERRREQAVDFGEAPAQSFQTAVAVGGLRRRRRRRRELRNADRLEDRDRLAQVAAPDRDAGKRAAILQHQHRRTALGHGAFHVL